MKNIVANVTAVASILPSAPKLRQRGCGDTRRPEQLPKAMLPQLLSSYTDVLRAATERRGEDSPPATSGLHYMLLACLRRALWPTCPKAKATRRPTLQSTHLKNMPPRRIIEHLRPRLR
jgi:hypothetical protein